MVAATLIVALFALRVSARNPGELSALDRGILRLVSPGQAAMSYVARAITGVAGRYVELNGVRAENESLHRENRQLRTELMEMRRLAEESGRYQRLLGLRDATPAETIAARVIAIDASPYFRVARVDIDRGEGTVRRGMPVLTPEGVVGRINRVAGKSSDVLLLVDPRSALDVHRAAHRAAAASCAASPARTATAAASSTWRAASRSRKATRSSPAAWAARSRATSRSGTSPASSRARSGCTRTSRSRPTSTSRA